MPGGSTSQESPVILHAPAWFRSARPALLAITAVVALGVWVTAPGLGGLARLGAWPLLRVLPLLVLLHCGQLLLAGLAWRALLPPPLPRVELLWRLRIVREGIDSLLPVAQMGGEVIGARLLSRRLAAPGAAPDAAASVIVDLAVEFLTQIVFLAAGLLALAWLSGHVPDRSWLVLAGVASALLGIVLSAPRLGALHGLERLLRGIARKAPALAHLSLDGLDAAALACWRRRRGVAAGIALHIPAWALGSVETWLVLRILGHPVGPTQALVIESLGMAARSAGFAVPAAIGVQEGGFVVAAAAIGLGAGPAVALSLVKRLREVLVGLLGLGLWRLEAAR